MNTVSNPPLLSFGSAVCHIRSSPPTWAAPGLGGPKVVPPSFDLPTVMLAAVRLEYARPESVEGPNPGRLAVSCGPIAQSQSPPPAVWSGKPRKLDTDPSCRTRKALQPAGTPVGPITNDWPNWSVLMLGSAALLLPCRRRFGLNVAGGGGEAGASRSNATNAAAESAQANATVRLPTYLFIAFPRCEMTGLSERVSRSLVFKPVLKKASSIERVVSNGNSWKVSRKTMVVVGKGPPKRAPYPSRFGGRLVGYGHTWATTVPVPGWLGSGA